MQSLGISAHDLLTRMSKEFSVPDAGLSPELMANLMRRQCARMFPCSDRALIAAVCRSLKGLSDDASRVEQMASDVLEDLQTCGDVIELSKTTLQAPQERSGWLVPAPPSFVIKGNRAYVFGIAPDNAGFLPYDLWQRVRSEGCARFLLLEQSGTEMSSTLRALGLRAVCERAWLTDDVADTAHGYLEKLRTQLRLEGQHGDMPGMIVLKHQSAERRSYRQRWGQPGTGSGLHITRLDRPHGAALWYVVDLKGGQPVRSLLLPRRGDASRACDQAWRAQLAIDAQAGNPGSYALRLADQTATLEIDFPIPLAVRRRLRFLSGARPRDGHPMTFELPIDQAMSECSFLERQLWLVRRDN